jgi:hypothetical protein
MRDCNARRPLPCCSSYTVFFPEHFRLDADIREQTIGTHTVPNSCKHRQQMWKPGRVTPLCPGCREADGTKAYLVEAWRPGFRVNDAGNLGGNSGTEETYPRGTAPLVGLLSSVPWSLATAALRHCVCDCTEGRNDQEIWLSIAAPLGPPHGGPPAWSLRKSFP